MNHISDLSPSLPKPTASVSGAAKAPGRRFADQLAPGLAWALKEPSQVKLAQRVSPGLMAKLSERLTPCALMSGTTGCGKTSAALWLMGAWSKVIQVAAKRPSMCPLEIDSDHPGMETPHWTMGSPFLIRARDLASATRRHGLGEGFAPEVESARKASILVIDDVGSEGANTDSIQDLLDWRYSKCKPTIATTGLTIAQLTAHLDAAYVRRIVDQHVALSENSEFPVLVWP